MAETELPGMIKWLGAGGVLGWLLTALSLQRVMVSKKTCKESKATCIKTMDIKLDAMGQDLGDIKRLVEKLVDDVYVPRGK